MLLHKGIISSYSTFYRFDNRALRQLLLDMGLETKVGSQETPGVTGKFGLGVWNEAGQRLVEFCQENALVIANTLFQQHKRRLHMGITRWSTQKTD